MLSEISSSENIINIIEGSRYTPSERIHSVKGKIDLRKENLDGFYRIKYANGGIYKGHLKENEKSGFGSLVINTANDSRIEVRGVWQEKSIRGLVLKIEKENKEKSIGQFTYDENKNYIMQSK